MCVGRNCSSYNDDDNDRPAKIDGLQTDDEFTARLVVYLYDDV